MDNLVELVGDKEIPIFDESEVASALEQRFPEPNIEPMSKTSELAPEVYLAKDTDPKEEKGKIIEEVVNNVQVSIEADQPQEGEKLFGELHHDKIDEVTSNLNQFVELVQLEPYELSACGVEEDMVEKQVNEGVKWEEAIKLEEKVAVQEVVEHPGADESKEIDVPEAVTNVPEEVNETKEEVAENPAVSTEDKNIVEDKVKPEDENIEEKVIEDQETSEKIEPEQMMDSPSTTQGDEKQVVSETKSDKPTEIVEQETKETPKPESQVETITRRTSRRTKKAVVEESLETDSKQTDLKIIEKPVEKDEPEQLESELKESVVDVQVDVEPEEETPKRGRPRASRRLVTPKVEKIVIPEKKSIKRVLDIDDKLDRSFEPKTKVPLTSRSASSRTTISSSEPSTRPDSRKRPAPTNYDQDFGFKKYHCEQCKYSTDRLNNIVYHKKYDCSYTQNQYKAQVEKWKQTLQSPKSNNKRSSR